MTETINLVDRCKFIEKDLPSSGSMIVEIDGWVDGGTRDESERNWHLEYKRALIYNQGLKQYNLVFYVNV